jgi:integrase
VELSTAKRDVEVLGLFLDWYTIHYGIVSPNPFVEEPRQWGSIVAERARRYKFDLLFHLFSTTKESKKRRIRKYLPSKRAERGAAPTKRRPEKKFRYEDFLLLIEHERDPRNLLIWLLLGAGGLRVSEVAHLFTSDLSWNLGSGQTEVLLVDPTYGRVNPKLPGTRQEYLRSTFHCCPRDQLPLHHIAFAGFKGMRFQEAKTAGVTWLHTDFGRLAWKAHVKYLPFRRAVPARNHPWHLVNIKHNAGQPITLRNITELLKSACGRLSLRSPANPHALRHMYVDTLVNVLGIPLHEAQILVRHCTPESTEVYSRVSVEVTRRALERLSGKLPVMTRWEQV